MARRRDFTPGEAMRFSAIRQRRAAEQEIRLARARPARNAYRGWLLEGGVQSQRPMPKPVKNYLGKYGPDALEDLAP